MTCQLQIVFTAPRITHGFMKDDIGLLSEYADVLPLDLSECGGWQRSEYLYKLRHALVHEHAQIVLCYFVMAKYTPLVATLTKLLRRKLIVVTGGIDATYVRDIDWGDMRSPLRRKLFAYVMQLADSVLSFSNSSRDELLEYGRPRRVRTAYLAVDTETFAPAANLRAHRVVTACYDIDRGTWIQKGIETFVRAASFAPEIEFLVIGQVSSELADELKTLAMPNLRFTNRRFNQIECAEAFQSAMVYVQASAHEGFGVSLAQAMACGCVPVVANRYAMPEVVGDTGYLVPFNDPRALADAIREALQHPEKGLAARQRVVENFTVQRRDKILREEIEFVLGRHLPTAHR